MCPRTRTARPSGDMLSHYEGNLSRAATQSMASSGMGGIPRVGCTPAAVRVYLVRSASAAQDHHQAHGGTVPFMLQRIQTLSRRWASSNAVSGQPCL
jgi:hypothetical protein